MHPYVAEFMGTMFLLLMGTGVVANVVLKGTLGNNGGWIVITTGWALGVFIGVVVAGPYSGAHLNPAVTLGLAVAGKFDWSEVPFYMAIQMIGAMSGAFLTWLMYKDHFEQTQDQNSIRGVFCTGPAIANTFPNIMSEIIGTFVLIFTVFYISDGSIISEKGETPVGLGSVGAIPVAFLVWVIGLSLGGTTGYAINPARDLGPRIVHALLPISTKGDSGWNYAWIPVSGPIIGALLAALFYIYCSL
ncbi:MAG: aquaporin family protein [Cyclobacteriaceae bacterium]|nr:aquaporin family protein [Cyclobacteriaceae bacterium]